MMCDSSYKNPTEVELNQLILNSHTDARSATSLNKGQLLKWMDTVACLSAERHAKSACVTALMDDLLFDDQSISVGQVVNLRARVNRAFNTSMEVGVQVRTEDLLTGRVQDVCEVLFTFVALDEKGQKVRLNPVDPFTQEEKLQYSLAAERRRRRLHPTPIPLNHAPPAVSGDASGSVRREIKPSDTTVESVELVLPEHANHHKTTFGGQIMAWMHGACTISATRLCRAHPQLIAVDELKFLGPSKVGDRIIIKATVNNTFDKRIEVGCTVGAYAIGGEVRPINSAYFIFGAPEGAEMVKLVTISEEEKRRASEAVVRERQRKESQEIMKSVGPVVAVTWSPQIGHLLNLNNLKALMRLQRLANWQPASVTDGISLSEGELYDLACVKATMEVTVPAEKVFALISDKQRMRSSDPLIKSCDTVQEVDQDNTILHLVLNGDGISKCDDMVLLVSRRQPSESREQYAIAYRSVIHGQCPPTEEYERVEHLCSGWLIEPLDEGRSHLTYLNQVTKTLDKYLREHVRGSSDLTKERAQALVSFLLNN